jgi:hypothetical protein
MRTCIVHIGTHKTGTTSLQLFTATNRAALESAGLALVMAGRTPNFPYLNYLLASKLSSQATETRASLAQELQDKSVAASLITSEDLSLLYTQPDALGVLASAIRDANYTPKILVYLRPQAPYAESMYVERIKQGEFFSMSTFIEQILETGAYLPDSAPVHLEFRYSRLLAPWVETFGKENVIVRSYEAARGATFIFEDFLQTVARIAPGFGQTSLEFSVSQPRANESLTFGGLLETAFVKLLPHRPPQAEPRTIVQAQIPDFPAELLDKRFALITREETLRFLSAFGPDNAVIEREFGVHIPFQNESDVPPANDPYWQKALLERAIFDRLLTVWLEASRQKAT